MDTPAETKGSPLNAHQQAIRIGVIGGSGLYEMDALTDREEVRVTTPFGDPSSAYIVGTLDDRRVAFLARHGPGLGHFPMCEDPDRFLEAVRPVLEKIRAAGP